MRLAYRRINIIAKLLAMRVQKKHPSKKQLKDFLQSTASQSYSYPEVGASDGTFPEDYLHSYDRFYLGTGQAIWEQSRELIRSWQMFPSGWTFAYPGATPTVGQEVAVCFRQFTFWWKNVCRVVYCYDEANQYGFAYGTLSTHVGRGEEYFGVERDEEGRCWFVIKAFSLPQYWGTRLFPRFMRAQQRNFINQAGQQMQELVRSLQVVAA